MASKHPTSTTSTRRSGPTPISSSRKAPKNHGRHSSTSKSTSSAAFQAQDIGGSSLPSMLSSMLYENLIQPDANGKRLLSSPLLSDEKGLSMWSQITYLPNYYQTRDEIELLERCGGEIVQYLGIDNLAGKELVVVDLGAGDIRKVLPLLQHLSTLCIPISYYALDLSHPILVAAMSHLRKLSLPNITCRGLWGTFDSGLAFVKTLPQATPRLFLSLGSSFGNDFHTPAVTRLLQWRNEMREDDRMLLGMDGTTDFSDIWESYHPNPGGDDLFERFMRNGLVASNKALGVKWYKHEDWEVEGALTTEPYVMHRFVYTARRTVRCKELGLVIKKGEKIDCYEAFKYGVDEMRTQFWESGLKEIGVWTSGTGRINQYLLSRDHSFDLQ